MRKRQDTLIPPRALDLEALNARRIRKAPRLRVGGGDADFCARIGAIGRPEDDHCTMSRRQLHRTLLNQGYHAKRVASGMQTGEQDESLIADRGYELTLALLIPINLTNTKDACGRSGQFTD